MIDLLANPKADVMDQSLLAEGRRHLPSLSSNALLNEALRRLVMQERDNRQRARERLRRMHQDGLFDYSALEAAEE